MGVESRLYKEPLKLVSSPLQSVFDGVGEVLQRADGNLLLCEGRGGRWMEAGEGKNGCNDYCIKLKSKQKPF